MQFRLISENTPKGDQPAAIDALPEGPGVYLFYGENALPLYVGKSTGIRKRVLSHFAADHATDKEMSLAQQVRRVLGPLGAGAGLPPRNIASAASKRSTPMETPDLVEKSNPVYMS